MTDSIHTSIPNIKGFWEYQNTVIRRNNRFEIPNLNNTITVNSIAEIEQNNEFISLKIPANELRPLDSYLLGVLTKTYTDHGKYFWTLTFSDEDDNGVFTYTISDMSCDNLIMEFTGKYTESGFLIENPQQKQTVGTPSLKRIQ
jgi:hypothetical protein